jgi:hypothetical protein
MKTLNSNTLKKRSFLKAVIPILILFCMFIPKTALSQAPLCNYLVHNGLECSITITVNFFDDCNQPIPCKTQTFTIASNTSVYPNCSSCGQLCNIVVIINTINGTPPGTGTNIVDNGTFYSSTSGGSIPGTCGGFGTFNMDWHYDNTYIGGF